MQARPDSRRQPGSSLEAERGVAEATPGQTPRGSRSFPLAQARTELTALLVGTRRSYVRQRAMQVDTTISLDRLDTDALLREWRWIVPADHRPFRMTMFGDWFFEAPDGSVHMLDLLEGDLKRIADSMAALAELDKREDKREELYLEDFVVRCRSEGVELKEGECLGWRLHPKLGGTLSADNIQPFSIRLYQSLVGQLLRQLRGMESGAEKAALKFVLPDGREV